MAYILGTLLLWIISIYLVHFNQWKDYYPTLLFSALFSIVFDLYGVVCNQWVYYGPVVGGLSLWSVLGVAPAEGVIFVRLFPQVKNLLIKIAYLICWALLNTIAERIFTWAGWIGYLQWNSFRAFLFYLFFFGAVWLQEYWYNGTGRLR